MRQPLYWIYSASLYASHYYSNHMQNVIEETSVTIIYWTAKSSGTWARKKKIKTLQPRDEWLMRSIDLSKDEKNEKCAFWPYSADEWNANKRKWRMERVTGGGRVSPWRMFLCSSSSAVGLWLSRLKTDTVYVELNIMNGLYFEMDEKSNQSVGLQRRFAVRGLVRLGWSFLINQT